MGIKNFKIFLKALNYVSNELSEYDSILIDIQSFLYRAIQNSFKSEESELRKDVCIKVLNDLSALFYSIFSRGQFKDLLRIIICFDGTALPLKLPTQKLRRNNIPDTEGKSLYQTLIFGHNILSIQVYDYIIENLKNNCANFFSNTNDIKIPSKMQFFILGSGIIGEGEHKIFYFNDFLKCKNPLIVSVDNDVFIISLSKFSKFSTIQIYKSANIIWNVNLFVSNYIRCTKECFIYATFLFGNDFIPAVINLTEKNSPVIHEALNMCEKDHMPYVFFTILKQLLKTKKLKYVASSQIEERIILEFWKNVMWVKDYYEKYNFEQMFMENLLFEIFDRHQIITVLLDLTYSEEIFNKACLEYKNLKTAQPTFDPKTLIFTAEQLQKYGRFFPQSAPQKTYHVIEISVL